MYSKVSNNMQVARFHKYISDLVYRCMNDAGYHILLSFKQNHEFIEHLEND